jgi:hypothetical protein
MKFGNNCGYNTEPFYLHLTISNLRHHSKIILSLATYLCPLFFLQYGILSPYFHTLFYFTFDNTFMVKKLYKSHLQRQSKLFSPRTRAVIMKPIGVIVGYISNRHSVHYCTVRRGDCNGERIP